MLRKLLKHDFISVFRLFLPIMIIVGALTLIAYAVNKTSLDSVVWTIFAGLLFPVSIIALIAACFAMYFIPVVHFYRSLITGEGYLSFTLPVRVELLVVSKLIVNSIATLVNLIITIGGIFLLASTKGEIDFSELVREFGNGSGSLVSLLLPFAILIIIAAIMQQFCFCLAIALGQSFGKSKLVGSAIAYFIIYAVVQIINLVLLAIFFLCLGLDGAEALIRKPGGLSFIMGILALEYAVIAVASYIITCRCFKNRLNLA